MWKGMKPRYANPGIKSNPLWKSETYKFPLFFYSDIPFLHYFLEAILECGWHVGFPFTGHAQDNL